MSRFRLFFLPLLALGAAAAGTSRADAQARPTAAQALRSAEARLEGRLDPGTQREVIAIIDSAITSGLPVELSGRLVSRALQGALGREIGEVPQERIFVAVREHAHQLMAARRALASATLDEIDAAAEALNNGVAPATLRSLRNARPRSSLAVPLVVLVDLIVQGVPADTAADLIIAITENQAADVQYYNLRLQVASDIGAGTLPIVAASTRTRGVLAASASSASAALSTDAANGPQRTGTTRSARPPGGPPPSP